MARPKWLEHLREHLVVEWNASIADGYEADDSIGIAQSLEPVHSVVCSIDKDLKQLPGNHYHFVNRTWLEISPLEAWRNFYYQLLVGDSTDNIKGCPGIGPVKAERLLRDCLTESTFYNLVAKSFYDVYKEEWFNHLQLNAQLLYVLRKENDTWKPPILEQQEMGQPLLSSKSGKAIVTEPMKVPMINGIP